MRPRLSLLLALLGLSAVGATCKGRDSGSSEVTPPSTEDLTASAVAPVAELAGVDIGRVPPTFRSDAIRVLNESFCYCGCARTVASCLANRDTCSCVECSERMAEFVLDAYERGSSTADVESSLLTAFSEAYNARPRAFDPAGQPSLGPEDAAHVLVEFADFRCPHCRGAFAELVEFVRKRSDVRLLYYYFPLSSFGEVSLRAARAAEAARAQGRFWPMATLLYKNQRALEEDDIRNYAREVGLDMERFEKDLTSEATEKAIFADKSIGTSAGVQATPQVYVDGRPLGLPHGERNLALRVAMEGDRESCD